MQTCYILNKNVSFSMNLKRMSWQCYVELLCGVVVLTFDFFSRTVVVFETPLPTVVPLSSKLKSQKLITRNLTVCFGWVWRHHSFRMKTRKFQVINEMLSRHVWLLLGNVWHVFDWLVILPNNIQTCLDYINPFAPTAPETARKKQWCFKKSNLCETSS